MADWLDIDKRVDHALVEIDKRIDRIDQIFTDKIEEVRELVNGLSFSIVADAKQIKKPEPPK